MRQALVNGTKLELVENGFDTRVHACDGCWFHENKIVCDLHLDSDPGCGVTRVYKEVK